MNSLDSVKNTMELESKAILDAFDNLDPAAVETVIDRLASCKGKVCLAGCGTSGAAAKKIAHTLSCINIPAIQIEPSDAVHGGMGVVTDKDIVIFLTKGGATTEIDNMIAPARAKGAYLIAVTENEGSMLAGKCDLLLKVKIEKEPDKFNVLATSSILATLSVFDAIAIAVMERTGFSKEDFGIIHPGGAVGIILNHKPLYDK